MSKFVLTVALVLIAVSLVTAQQDLDQHHQMNQHGAQVMGFDQEKTTHHFYLYADGGAIDVAVNDASDKTNLDAIRAHLPHIATMFSHGNFDAPMLVHDTNVPGTVEMAKLKDRINYKYAQTSKGGRVIIIATDAEALKAVHAFLKFQITDHKTGDSLEVSKPGVMPHVLHESSFSRCLPPGLKLDDIIGTKFVGSRRPENRGSTTIEQALGELNATCKNDRLMDASGKEIYFYHLIGCWGNPPRNYHEILQNQQDEIAKLKQQYTVVEITCNPSGRPIV
jgi:hypothetical protein